MTTKTLLNSTWYVAAHKADIDPETLLVDKNVAKRKPWLVNAPVLFYAEYEDCAGNIDPASETVVEVTVSVVGTRKKLTLD